MKATSTLRPSANSPKIGRRTVGQHVARAHALAPHHHRPLVDAGALVGALILDQIVDIDAGIAPVAGLLVGAHHDALGVDAFDHAVALGDHSDARVAPHRHFEAGADQRRVGLQQRHRLALHVGSHQRAVCVVILQERDQRGGHRDQLVGRHVHVLHVFGASGGELAADSRGNQLVGEAAALVETRVGLRDDLVFLIERRQIHDSIRDAGIFDDAVRRLDKSVLVDARIGRKRRDESDVGTLGRFDRAYAAIVRRMNVADFESGALARQSSGSER